MISTDGDRVGEVLARLAHVTDPELDEPVTELGFVTGVSIDADERVHVGFRLPTYWCAANFAFLMADDMRREVMALPWVRGVGVELGEHMYAETINRAMTQGQSFQEAFAEEADGDLDAVRRIFAVKAFQRRQMVLLDHLLATGLTPDTLMALDIEALRELPLESEGVALVSRYLERRDIPGPADDDQPAFVDARGHPVSAAGFPAHRRTLRGVAVNVDFNGALCRGLLAARFNEGEHAPKPETLSEPTLLDFVRDAAGGNAARA